MDSAFAYQLVSLVPPTQSTSLEDSKFIRRYVGEFFFTKCGCEGRKTQPPSKINVKSAYTLFLNWVVEYN